MNKFPFLHEAKYEFDPADTTSERAKAETATVYIVMHIPSWELMQELNKQ